MYATVIVFVQPQTVTICYLVIPDCPTELHDLTPGVGVLWCVIWLERLDVEGFI